MLPRRQVINLQLQQLADAALLVLALWVSHAIRYFGTVYLNIYPRIPPFYEFLWLAALLVPFGPLLLELQGFYNQPLQKTPWKSFLQIIRASIWFFVIVATCVVFFRLEVPSRSVLLLFGIFGTLFLMGKEQIIIRQLRRRAQHGEGRERVLIAGTPQDAEQLLNSFTPEEHTEMDVAGTFDIEKQSTAELVEALHKHSVGRVIFAGGHGHLDRIEAGIGACETEGVEAWLVADFVRTSIAKAAFDVMGDRPILVFRTTPDVSWALFVKNLLDRIGAALLLVTLSPLLAVVAVLIKFTSPGPVIFRQQRSGKNGKPFTMYKFRSMRSDAEMERAELEAFNEMSGPVFKIEQDPRITPLGVWLRRTSIDETPQLVNVLLGHMSLVGPRPLPLYEVDNFENTAQRRRLSVKPGLTCLWQISGRNRVTDFQEWVNLDLKYIDNWSLWLDFKILLKTIPVVLLGLGAK